MTGPAGSILDYASPASRGKLRLPSQSVLDIHEEPGSLTVVETLAGKGGAIAALIFAAITLILFLTATSQSALAALAREHSLRVYAGILLVLCFAAAQMLVMALVINNSWRRTVLRVSREGITLQFNAPLSPMRRFAWRADEIADVRVEITDTEAVMTLGVLEIHPESGPTAYLFTDHAFRQLELIVQLARQALGLPPAPAHALSHPQFPQTISRGRIK